MSEALSHLAEEFTIPFSNPALIFGILLLIVLTVPIILQKINVPSIIGLIIAGVVIGPFGLNLIQNDNVLEMFSMIGLLYIMFIVGLELDLTEFAAHKNRSLTFGLFTFLVPLLIGFPIVHYFLGYGLNAAFLTASMFATHTLVTYPIVSRMGVSRNQAVAVSVGGTIMTDTVVLIILAFIVANNKGDLSFAYLIRMLFSLTIFGLIVFGFIPRVAKWFFRHMPEDKYSYYIFVLFVVFLSAFLAELAGVELIIGAFAAGLALNKHIPHTSALMNRIEFIGNALFIPIFLISVGMLVNVQVVFQDFRTIVIALSLTVAAIIGKWIAAFFTQKTFKYSVDQRNLIFGLTTAHAAATLAIILVGYKAGILDEYILNGTIILILISCIVASFYTQRAAKNIAISQESEPITSSFMGKFGQEKIMIPVADPSNIKRFVELAILMKDPKSTNSIALLGVVANDKEAERNIISFRKKIKESVDEGVATDVKIRPITTIDYNIPAGIVRTSRELMADIVILGWPSRTGLLEKLVGEKVDLIVKNLDKSLFVCSLTQKMVLMKRIFLIVPPLAEKEIGFELWLNKVVKIAQELSIPIQFFGFPETYDAVMGKKRSGVHFDFIQCANWNVPLSCSEFIRKEDLIVFVSAHQGSVSYNSVLDHLPTKLEDRFPENNRIVVFPKIQHVESLLGVDDHIFIP
ncbi:MAG: cation:proton antiporter [Petrimonas sp.]|nr:cation:proton antiporter [Petrimonas sp.]